MRKYVRKVAKIVPPARLSGLTTQIEADLAQDLLQHGMTTLPTGVVVSEACLL